MENILLRLIRVYQRTSFINHQMCRYIPTCSQYTYEAIEKYGSIKGLFLGLKRILRCHPWSKTGPDPLK